MGCCGSVKAVSVTPAEIGLTDFSEVTDDDDATVLPESRVSSINSSAKSSASSAQDVVRNADPVIGDADQFNTLYRIMDPLGVGAYAQVFTVQHLQSGALLAVKIIDIRNSSSDAGKSANKSLHREACCRKEIEIMAMVAESAFCVGLHDAFMTCTHCYMVMDRCSTSLVEAMEGSYFDEIRLRQVVCDTLKGLESLHRLEVIHRDVKPENLLYFGPDEHFPCGRVRLCDFGLSHFDRNGEPPQEVSGTAPYMCPEMLFGHPYDGKADVWSLGVMTYVIQIGRFPYTPSESTPRKMKEAIRAGVPPTYAPVVDLVRPTEVALDFIKATLQRDPRLRLSAEQASSHPYVCREATQAELACRTSLRPILHAARGAGAFGPRPRRLKQSVDNNLPENFGHSQSSVMLWKTRVAKSNGASSDLGESHPQTIPGTPSSQREDCPRSGKQARQRETRVRLTTSPGPFAMNLSTSPLRHERPEHAGRQKRARMHSTPNSVSLMGGESTRGMLALGPTSTKGRRTLHQNRSFQDSPDSDSKLKSSVSLRLPRCPKSPTTPPPALTNATTSPLLDSHDGTGVAAGPWAAGTDESQIHPESFSPILPRVSHPVTKGGCLPRPG